MDFEEARSAAEESGSMMVYQESRSWHHRGIHTEFSDEDHSATDWQPLELSRSLCHNFK